MGNCCKKTSYGLYRGKKRGTKAMYQLPSAILDFHNLDQFVGPSLSSQGASPSAGTDGLRVNEEASPSRGDEKMSDSSSEPELPTAALPPRKRPSSIPLLNLTLLTCPRPEAPKICIQQVQSWIESPDPMSKRREDGASLTFSSSSRVEVAQPSSSVQSKLDISAFGVLSSDTKSIGRLDSSPTESVSQPFKFDPKVPFDPPILPQSSLFTIEDGVSQSEEACINLKIVIPRLSHPSEASTQTFRPVVTTRVKCTQKVEIVRNGEETRLNQYVIVKEIRTEESRGTWYLAKHSSTSFTIWEYSKSSQQPAPRVPQDSLPTHIGILDRISHPNVLQLLEVIDSPEEDTGYFVFEGSVGFVSRMKVGEKKAREVFRMLAEGVEYLHEVAQVVHLGIRVEALLWTEKGEVKLSDFTSAQSVKDSEDTYRRLSQPLDALSPEGCGPRLFQGKPADIWACGITLYRLLYGSTPFSGPTICDMYEHLRHEKYPLYRLILPSDTSPALLSLLEGLLEKDPKARLTIRDVVRHPWLRSL